MKNLHHLSSLLTPDVITKIQTALDASWSVATVDPENKHDWSLENKALGQCAITAVLINELFGGQIIYDKTNFHIWNELPDGTQHDFTRSQFLDERIFSIYKYKTKEDVLYDERGQKSKITERYQTLKQAFNRHYQDL